MQFNYSVTQGDGLFRKNQFSDTNRKKGEAIDFEKIYIDDILAAHNKYRTIHQAPRLTLDPAVSCIEIPKHVSSIGLHFSVRDLNSDSIFKKMDALAIPAYPFCIWCLVVPKPDFNSPILKEVDLPFKPMEKYR